MICYPEDLKIEDAISFVKDQNLQAQYKKLSEMIEISLDKNSLNNSMVSYDDEQDNSAIRASTFNLENVQNQTN